MILGWERYMMSIWEDDETLLEVMKMINNLGKEMEKINDGKYE
jgi:hypothetical protein